jgi:type I restriction-modification system DNA methylase subunit
MGGGQFVKEIERRKRIAGKTDSEIKRTVFGIESNILRRNYAVNKHKLVGDYQVGNALTMDFNGMKFDVVIGNPPYQLTNSKKIWPDFVQLALNKVVQNGYVGLVIPTSWLESNGSAYKKIRTRLTTNYNLLVISRDANKYFSVGQDICYIVSNSMPYKGTTNYIKDSISETINLIDGIPKTSNDLKIESIINIITNKHPKINWIINDKINCVKSEDISNIATETHIYPIIQSTANKGYINVLQPDSNALKLAVNFSASYYNSATIDNNMPVTTHGIGSLMGYVLLDDYYQGLMIRSYLTSKLIRFFVSNYKKNNTGFSDAVKRRMIPSVPNKFWTDDDVFAHFELPIDDIDYINNCIN